MISIDSKANLNTLCNLVRSLIQSKYNTSPKSSKFKEIFAKALNNNTYAACCAKIPFKIAYSNYGSIDNYIKEALTEYRIQPLKTDEYMEHAFLQYEDILDSEDQIPMTKEEMISIINTFFDQTTLIEPSVAFPGYGGLSKDEAIQLIQDSSNQVFKKQMAQRIDLGGKKEDEHFWHFCPVRKYVNYYDVEPDQYTDIENGISELNVQHLIQVANRVIGEHCLACK